jgi:mannose/fructose/N-acetylgalactosamine-specific phosphotransferase system component IID
VQTLELVMPVHRFAVQVRRRKGDRTIHLDWNTTVRRLEPPVCEATAGMERPRLVCDDALHLVVPAGLAPCAGCGRAFCRACHSAACPKCGASLSEAGPALGPIKVE